MRPAALSVAVYLTVAACAAVRDARAADAAQTPPAAEIAGDPSAAVWKAQRIDFLYVGRTSRYSCEGLRDKVRAMLIDLGARREPTIIAVGCAGHDRGSHVRGSAHAAPLRLKIEFFSPALPAAGANPPRPGAKPSRAGAKPSRAGAKPSPVGDLEAVDARFRPFRIASDAFRNMGIGDCELVQQFARQILPRFTVRRLSQDIVCVPYEPSASRFLVRGEILKPSLPGG